MISSMTSEPGSPFTSVYSTTTDATPPASSTLASTVGWGPTVVLWAITSLISGGEVSITSSSNSPVEAV